MDNGLSFSFGRYCLTPKERRLTRNGEAVRIPPKAFDILVVLVMNQGRLVEKQEILESVWQRSFVEEANVQVQISTLRRILDTDSESYIETVPKIGYRFVGVVEAHADQLEPGVALAAESPSNANDLSISPDSHNVAPFRRPLYILLFVVAGALGLVAISWYLRPEPVTLFKAISISKLTNSGNDSLCAISPDGNNLVFQRFQSGKSSLWVKNLQTGAEKQLFPPSDRPIESVTFSPDGNSLYFTQLDVSDPNKQTALFELAFLDGDPRQLAKSVDSRVTFSPDGERIAFIRIDRSSAEWDLIVADSNGGNEKIVARSFPAELIRWPAWSPNSNKIAAFKMNAEGDQHGNRYSLIEIDVDSGGIVEIGRDRWQTFGHIAWVRAGSGLVFTAAERAGAPWQVWYVDRATGGAEKITNDTSDYSDVSVDRSSSLLTVVKKDFRSSIWIGDKTGFHDSLRQVTEGAANEEGNKGIAFMPDGRLLYTATTNGNWDIWIMNPDGSKRMRLTSNEFLDVEPVAGGDGKSAAYVSQEASGRTHIWKMEPDGGNRIQLTNGLFESYPALSPDGKWLLYVGGESVKEIKLWKVARDHDGPTVLSERPVRSKLAVSPDGTLVAFASHESSQSNVLKIFVIRIADGEIIKVLDPPPGFIPNTDIKWTPDGGAVTYKRMAGAVSNLWNLPVDGSRPREVTRFDADLIYSFDWSGNGSLALTRGSASTDIVSIRPDASR